MNLAGMRFPRQMEAHYGPDVISQALMGRASRPWSGGALDIPLIAMKDPLKKALQAAMLRSRRADREEGPRSREPSDLLLASRRGDLIATSHGTRLSMAVVL